MNRWIVFLSVCGGLFVLSQASALAADSGKKNLLCSATNGFLVYTLVVDYDKSTVTEVRSQDFTYDASITDSHITWSDSGTDFDITRASGMMSISWRKGVSGPTSFKCEVKTGI